MQGSFLDIRKFSSVFVVFYHFFQFASRIDFHIRVACDITFSVLKINHYLKRSQSLKMAKLNYSEREGDAHDTHGCKRGKSNAFHSFAQI